MLISSPQVGVDGGEVALQPEDLLLEGAGGAVQVGGAAQHPVRLARHQVDLVVQTAHADLQLVLSRAGNDSYGYNE